MTEMVLDLLDYDVLRNEYNEAYIYFFENIWDSKFRTDLPRGKIHRNKSGNFFIVSGPLDETNCTIFAWEEKPLKAIRDFLVLVGSLKTQHSCLCSHQRRSCLNHIQMCWHLFIQKFLRNNICFL